MEPPPAIEKSLAEATQHVGKYQWTKAAEDYQRILSQLENTNDQARIADVSERLARSFFYASFQSRTRDEFKNLMGLSQDAEEKAVHAYQTSGLEDLAKRAQARASFSKFWALDDVNEKRDVLGKCVRLAQQSAHFLEVRGHKAELAETLLDLLSYKEKAIHLSQERRELVDLFESALETAWRIVEDETLAQEEIRLGAVNLLARLYMSGDYVLEKPRYEELERKLEKLKDRIPKIQEKIGTTYADALSAEALLILAGDLEGDIPKALGLYEKGMGMAKELQDQYVIGRFHIPAAAMTRWAGLGEEYAEKRREQLEKTIELAQYAIVNLQPSSPGEYLKRAYGIQVDASNYLALTVETNIDKKRSVLRKAIETTKSAMRYENQSFLTGMGHQLSRAMYLLAMMDAGNEEKTRLLKEALPIREETVRVLGLLSPHSFSRGAMINYLALIKAELSDLENNHQQKLNMLKEAASDMAQCVKLCATITGIVPGLPGQVRAQAQYAEWHGDILQKLYNLTSEAPIGREAIHAYQQSISHLAKSGSLASIAPIRWKIAQAHDQLREYQEASESFRQAAQDYGLAGKKIQALNEVFQEYARYMEAWEVIEEARLKHDREQYTASAEAYTKAAEHLRSIKNWSHLSRHYTACSFLELGEGMSRQERQQSAIESFNAAKTNFQEGLVELEQKPATTPADTERRELDNWLEMTRGRLKYTLARLQLEEAKILDSRMEEEASSAKYRLSSDSFRKLSNETLHQGTRAELDTLSTLCEAWAKMKSAEATASPELYAEAASTFKLVESKPGSKKTKLGALANSAMCKALELGVTFRRTRDPGLYQSIKTNLETAADFYEEAGIRKAADWTRATQRYFDALTYLRQAEIEIDSKKRKELFQLAENHLQLAATIYGEAGYVAKREESLRHLERAREEKQLLLMPVEVLAESPTVADVTISPMSLAEDRATGLEKFENAHVVGSMRLSATDVTAGEQITIDLQLVNIGKAPAILGMIESLAVKGLELQAREGELSIESHGISLRGRRLEHLKSYAASVTVRARRKGDYVLRPRLTFLDENGKHGSYAFDPVMVRSRETGFLGWIRGPS